MIQLCEPGYATVGYTKIFYSNFLIEIVGIILAV